MHDPIYASLDICENVVLPEPDNVPASAPQPAEVQSIAPPVSFDLGTPVCRQARVPLGEPPAVPEIAIYEDHHLLARENHVRAAGQRHDVRAVAQAAAVGDAAHGPLAARVHAADARHVPTAHLGSQVVSHPAARSGGADGTSARASDLASRASR